MSIFLQNQADFILPAMPIAAATIPAGPNARAVFKRIEELQNQAKKLITSNKTEALNFLRQAADLWTSDESYKKLENRAFSKYVDGFLSFIEPFIEGGEKDLAKAVLDQAETVLNFSKNHDLSRKFSNQIKKFSTNQVATLRKKIDAMPTPTAESTSATWQGLRHVGLLQTLAKGLITSNKTEALNFLRQALAELETIEGQKELEALTINKQVNEYQKLANWFIQADDKTDALKLLNRAADLSISEESYKKLGSEAFFLYISNLLTLADLLIQADDGTKAKAVFNQAETVLNSDESKKKLPEFKQMLLTGQLANLSGKIDAMPTPTVESTSATWQGLEYVAELQNQAWDLIKSNKDEALRLLKQALTALETDEGRKALEEDQSTIERADYYKALADAFKKAGGNEKVLELLRKAADLLVSDKSYEKLKDTEFLVHIKALLSLAEQLREARDEAKAKEVFGHAETVLNSDECQAALQAIEPFSKRAREYQDLANSFKKVGWKKEALELLRKAADLLVPDESYEKLTKWLEFSWHVADLLSLAEQLREAGDGAKARAVLNRAETVLDFDKNRTTGRKLPEDKQRSLTKQLEALREKIDAMDY